MRLAEAELIGERDGVFNGYFTGKRENGPASVA